MIHLMNHQKDLLIKKNKKIKKNWYYLKFNSNHNNKYNNNSNNNIIEERVHKINKIKKVHQMHKIRVAIKNHHFINNHHLDRETLNLVNQIAVLLQIILNNNNKQIKYQINHHLHQINSK